MGYEIQNDYIYKPSYDITKMNYPTYKNPLESPFKALEAYLPRVDTLSPVISNTQAYKSNIGSGNSSWTDSLGKWAEETFTKDSMFNDKTGWFSPVTSALSGGLQALMAMKMYGLGKDQLAFQQDAFNKNYTMQKSLVQDNLRDTHDRRNSAYTGSEQLALANQGKLISGDDYVKKYIG